MSNQKWPSLIHLAHSSSLFVLNLVSELFMIPERCAEIQAVEPMLQRTEVKFKCNLGAESTTSAVLVRGHRTGGI